jgi:Icc-related predicted phosphoesterase
MKALIFSDIHNDWNALERLMDIEADYYFAAGDLVSWARGLDKAGQILQRRAGRVYVLPGNHESESQIAACCERFGLHAFHGRTLETAGVHVAGLGYSNVTPFDTPGEYSEEELTSKLQPFAGLKPLVLICHCPPKGTALDRAGPNRHFGSLAVLEFLRQRQPAYFFCGHIHEAEGATERIGATIGVNAGKKGYLLDFDKIQD